MNEEIKEILDDLLFITTLPNVSVKLSEEKLNQLKDYITNLKVVCEATEELAIKYQENERLKEQNKMTDEQIEKAFTIASEHIYKSRNEKAIEYIKNNYDFYYGDELYDSYQKIINILQGGDKDE